DRAARCEELGADVILDVLGAGGLADNVAMLATGGRLVVIGTQRGTRGEVDLMALMRKRASVHGTTLRARPLGEEAAIVTAVRAGLWRRLADGRLRAVAHERRPRAEAERGHELLDSGEVFGKLLLVTGSGRGGIQLSARMGGAPSGTTRLSARKGGGAGG